MSIFGHLNIPFGEVIKFAQLLIAHLSWLLKALQLCYFQFGVLCFPLLQIGLVFVQILFDRGLGKSQHQKGHQNDDYRFHELYQQQRVKHNYYLLQIHSLITKTKTTYSTAQIKQNLFETYYYNMQAQQKNYRFEKEDDSKWLPFLLQNGFVVIKNVLAKDDVSKATDLFWQWLQALGSGIDRFNTQTWISDNWPGSGAIGFFASFGGCHSKASWFIRTHPQVKNVFAKIWNTNSLITSFDTFIGWKPWWNQPKGSDWKPFVQNIHVDQNPYHKNGLHCVQGMVPLVDVRQDGVGGIQVVPRTNNNLVQQELTERYPSVKHSKSDWLQLRGNDPYCFKGKLVTCSAGDMILFDSRTLHGGKICEPSQQFKEEYKYKLARLAMTVTMVPRSLEKQGIKRRRFDAFKSRIGLTHWPQEYNTSSFGCHVRNIQKQNIKYQWPQLTPQIEDLI